MVDRDGGRTEVILLGWMGELLVVSVAAALSTMEILAGAAMAVAAATGATLARDRAD